MAAPAVIDNNSLEPDALENADDDDHDSGIGSDIESTRSGSITSSIIGYKYENGRRYHAYREGAYCLPNDEAEQSRLDLQHHIYRLAVDGALYLAPLRNDIKRCLDFGTGTGLWAIDFADEFPDCEVIGTDLSPIQPTWIPPNLKFLVDDVEEEWSYNLPNEAFDFIHGRTMGGALANWNLLFRQIFANLNPAGWCEMHEYECKYYSDNDPEGTNWPTVKKWIDLLNESSQKFGKDLNMGPQVKTLMTEAGFVDIEERIVRIPIGRWAKGKKNKELGALQLEHVCDCVDSYTPALFTRVLGWSMEDTEVFMTKCKEELRNPRNQLYMDFMYTYGKKPDV